MGMTQFVPFVRVKCLFLLNNLYFSCLRKMVNILKKSLSVGGSARERR